MKVSSQRWWALAILNDWVRPAFWSEEHLQIIRILSEDKLAPYSCDLAGVLNYPEKLEELNVWLRGLNGRGQFGLLSLSHDSSAPVDELLLDNSVVLRTSMQSDLKYRNEFPLPVFVEGKEFEDWKPIAKSKKPKIGFVGHSKLSLHHKLLNAGDEGSRKEYGYGIASGSEVLRTPVNIGLVIRSKALRLLRSDSRISTSFIERETRYFDGGVFGAQARADYLSNLNANAYSLCIRGSGNYSIRMYEAMAKGRIPVTVDTNFRLPQDDSRDWSRLGLFLKIHELDSIGQRLIEIHESLSDQEFISLQKEIRAFWESNLQRESFLMAAIPRIMNALVPNA